MNRDNQGYTLIELLVAMAIASIMLGAIYSAYQVQATTHMTQKEVVDLHQNARAAMILMSREIRMAGLDPTGTAGAGIITATGSCLEFSMDMNGDGTIGAPGEHILYKLMDDGTTDDCTSGNGLPNSASPHRGLGRKDGDGNLESVTSNIEALNFTYLDVNGNEMATPISDTDLPNIRTIELTFVARSNNPVSMRKQTDSNVYKNLRETMVLVDKSSSPDSLRRTRLASTIRCRNLGL